MVDREVDWPVWVVLGCSWGLCLRSGGSLGTYVGYLELLLGLYGWSWAVLGASIGGLGCTWAALGAYVGDLGSILGRSWASTCGPGPLLGPLCAVLGCSWSLCWRSWAALGAYVGGLGPLLGSM